MTPTDINDLSWLSRIPGRGDQDAAATYDERLATSNGHRCMLDRILRNVWDHCGIRLGRKLGCIVGFMGLMSRTITMCQGLMQFPMSLPVHEMNCEGGNGTMQRCSCRYKSS